MARKTYKKTATEFSIDEISALQHDLWRMSRKISGLGSLYKKAATDESGVLDVDMDAVGIGETLADYAKELDRLASVASEAEIHYGKRSRP